MDSTLRILVLEDDPLDAELIESELRNHGFVFQSIRAVSRPDFLQALDEFSPSLVLADFHLPAFDGLSALALLKERTSDVPFILVSGALGEERAVETMKQGATDYVLKHRLFRLGPAVKRALEEAEERRRRRTAEEAIKRSLREKELLLQEIHHRVKNNLQIVSSLLFLQSRTLTDAQAREALLEGCNRIRSMALIHETFYRSSDFSGINMEPYAKSLVQEIFSSFDLEGRLIDVQVVVENVYLDIDKAIPCGLIINELVTNAVKHAFRSGQAGQIAIHMSPGENGCVILRVSDNGSGLPEQVAFEKPSSFGLKLVHSLAAQLQGSVELEPVRTGTSIRISFPQN